MNTTSTVYSPDALSKQLLGCAIEVHKALGPGLIEKTYAQCLAQELTLQGVPFEQQVALPVRYKGVTIECGYRLDLLIDKQIVVELKAVEAVLPVHEAQLLTYLRLSNLRHGFLINFNVTLLRNGLKSFVL